jgi:hypothetical protein
MASPPLVVPAADLTTLAARNGDVFPAVRVMIWIDGHDALVNHSCMMPV